jgi:hypothetical protein
LQVKHALATPEDGYGRWQPLPEATEGSKPVVTAGSPARAQTAQGHGNDDRGLAMHGAEHAAAMQPAAQDAGPHAAADPRRLGPGTRHPVPVRCYGGMDYQRRWSASQSARHFGQLICDAWASDYLSSAPAEPEDLVTSIPATDSPTCTIWQAHYGAATALASPRVIGVWGLSQPSVGRRDTGRMRGHPRPGRPGRRPRAPHLLRRRRRL